MLATCSGVNLTVFTQQTAVSAATPACAVQLGTSSHNCTVNFVGLVPYTRYRFAVTAIGSTLNLSPDGLLVNADTFEDGEL